MVVRQQVVRKVPGGSLVADSPVETGFRVHSKTLQVPGAVRGGEPKREHCTDTKLMLSFPHADDGMPKMRARNFVFAFLPVRAVGLRFVVQGDFLACTADRTQDLH